MTIPFDERTVIEYAQGKPQLVEILGGASALKSKALTDGNVNNIFRVYNEKENKSFIVKQALPFSRRYPDFKVPVDRSRIEAKVLAVEARYCPEQTPKVYFHDAESNVNVIQDLNRHLMMREALMQRNQYPLVAKHIGTFMARTLFFTSDLYLSTGEKKAMVPQFINPRLCQIQEDLVFTEPYMDHPNNRWTRGLDQQAAKIHSDDALRSEMFILKEAYMTHAQALLHNDLHTGSVMLNAEETKVIDPEFAFFGPIAHDVGSYLGNLALAYAAQEFHTADAAERASYRRWLVATLVETWNIFEGEFMTLWENEGNGEWPSPGFRKKYMLQLLQDAAGFGAAEMMRRLVGLAIVPDFWSITDETIRARAESLGLSIGYAWVMGRRGVTSIQDLADMVTQASPAVV